MQAKHWLLALTTSTVLVLSGCNFGGTNNNTKETTTTDDTPTDTPTDTTTVSLSGVIDTSSLSTSDQSLVRTRARAFRDSGDAVVKLYTLDADGEYVDTNYTCSVSGGSYTCGAVAPDTEYVVRYVRDLGGGKVLELKSNASVGSSDIADADVDPITTMVAEAVVEAVKNALVGVTSDATLVESIVKSVKEAVTTTMTTLVKNGTIKVPSLVVEEDFATIQTTVTTNENLSTATGAVLSDDTVAATVTATSNEAKQSAFGELNASAQLQSIFTAIGWDEGMPGWVLSMFTAEYSNIDDSWTYGWLEPLVKSGYSEINATTLANNYENEYRWQIENLVRMGILDEGDANASFLTLSSTVNTAFQATDILAALKTELNHYYTIKAKAVADRNALENEYINNFPIAIAKVFPADYVDTITANTKLQNMAQLFVFMGFSEKMMNDLLSDEIGSNSNHMQILKNNMGENLLMSMYGNNMSLLLQYNDITINQVRLATDTYYDGMTQTNYVRVEWAGLSKLSWDMRMDSVDSNLFGDANITYPTQSGLATKALHLNTNYGVGFDLNPWNDQNNSFDINNAITDGVTGDYVVSIDYNGTIYTKTQHQYVLQGAGNLNPKLISPKAFPQWSDAADFNQTEYDAEMQTFFQEGVTNYLPNSDGNTTLKGAVFSWEAPDMTSLSLPSNVIAAYEVSISMSNMDSNGDGNVSEQEADNCNQNWESCNIEIYNTWWDEKPIRSTSITLPVPLQTTTGTNQYSIGVNLMFIDKTNGKRIAQGGNSWAQFTVGEGTALSGSEDIKFTGTISLDNTYATFATNGKIAVISESYTYNEANDFWENNVTTLALGTITDGNATTKTFTVDITSSVLKANSGNNKNISVIYFDDADTDDQFDHWTQTTNGEASYWLDNNWLWVENWGDLRINVDGDGGYRSYKVIKDSNTTVDNLNITVW